MLTFAGCGSFDLTEQSLPEAPERVDYGVLRGSDKVHVAAFDAKRRSLPVSATLPPESAEPAFQPETWRTSKSTRLITADTGAILAVEPIHGMSAESSGRVLSGIAAALGGFSADAASVHFLLRGVAGSSSDKRGTLLRLEWRLQDSGGRALARFTINVLKPEPPIEGQAPWQAARPAILDDIAQRTAAQLRPLLVNGNGAPAQGVSAGNAPAWLGLGAFVGAPGDGNRSLRTAITRSLGARGISVVDAPSPSVAGARLEVMTQRSALEDGDRIRIVWRVSRNGAMIGQVTQENRVPRHALEGSWGTIADHAADAAVHEIVKLLQERI